MPIQTVITKKYKNLHFPPAFIIMIKIMFFITSLYMFNINVKLAAVIPVYSNIPRPLQCLDFVLIDRHTSQSQLKAISLYPQLAFL
jgi:hypothetical protein